MIAAGRAVVDIKTKNLLKRIKPGQVAVINHKDIDELAAEEMIKNKVKAVVNFEPSISGTFLNYGPKILCDYGIPIVDVEGEFRGIKEGDLVEIGEDASIFVNKKLFCKGHLIDKKFIDLKMNESKENYSIQLEIFVRNTMKFIRMEKNILSESFPVPDLKTRIEGRQVLVVVRGKDYKKDLLALASYIEDMKPILIGVDGGADALLEFGLKPDVIVGDMDSISDRGLLCGAELVIHAYMDGRAPGLERVQNKGLTPHIFAMPGTSEDAALLLAYEKKADLIVAVGTHTNIIDFLEKGRHGMASTFLVRLKVGHILIDAKGVNKLYRSNLKIKYIAAVCFAAFFPLVVLGTTSPVFQHLLRLMLLQVRSMLGML
jgi:uncharacterized membrane-anchored protein